MKTLLVLVVSLWTASAAAQYSCQQVFSVNSVGVGKSTYRLGPGLLKLIERGQLSRDEIDIIFENRISEPIPDKISDRQNRTWFISYGADGIRYKVTLANEPGVDPLVLFVGPSTNAMERAYFRYLGRYVEDRVFTIKRKIRGVGIVRMPGSVQVKIYEKHGLRPSEVIKAIENYTGRILNNKDSRMIHQDTIRILGQLEFNGPLMNIFLAREANEYVLLTAFFP
jgi:hypothetical protein